MPTRSNIVSFDDAKRVRGSVRSGSAPKNAQEKRSGSAAGRSARSVARSAEAASTSRRGASSRTVAAGGRSETAARGAKASSATARSPKPSRGKAQDARRSSGASSRQGSKDPLRPSRSGAAGARGAAGKQPSRDKATRAQENSTQSNRAFFDDLAERHQKKKRANAKEKADRQFDRTYGKADRGASSAAEEAGPRAAVYKGEMGRSHKRSAETLNKGTSARASKGASASEVRGGGWKKHIARLGITVACIALAAVVLYDPARMYYQQIREVARLQAEYEAIVARNDSLQASVDHLSTEGGIADAAREQLGWVNPGENAVNVSGLDEKESDFQANVVSDQVKPPDTWYSSFLDPFFGVE